MICPRCNDGSLTEMDRDGVTVDRCARCRGIWLDRGELEKLIARGREVDRAAVANRLEEGDDGPRPGHLADDDRARDDDHDDDDRRHRDRGRKRSWWEIFD